MLVLPKLHYFLLRRNNHRQRVDDDRLAVDRSFPRLYRYGGGLDHECALGDIVLCVHDDDSFGDSDLLWPERIFNFAGQKAKRPEKYLGVTDNQY